MKIRRIVNLVPVDFKLTPTEMRECYYEQQRIFDIEDVKQELEDQDLVGLATDDEIEDMAYDMRDYIYDTGCDWREAVEHIVGQWYAKRR